MAKKSMKTKLLLRFGLVVPAAIIIVGLIGILLTQITTMKTLEENMRETVLVASVQVQNRLMRSETVLEEIGKNSELVRALENKDKKIKLLEDRAEEYGFVEYGVLDTEGKSAKGSSFSGTEWCQKALAGEFYIGTPAPRADGSFVMYLSAPVVESGKIKGVVYAGIDATFLSNIAGQIQVGENGYTYIIDKNGTVIAHKDYTKVTEKENAIALSEEDSAYNELAALEQQALAAAEGETVYGGFRENKSSMRAALSRIADTDDWVIAVAAAEGDFTGTIVLGAVIMLISLILCTAAALVVIVVYVNRIVKPIVELRDAMTRVAEGDLGVSVEVNGEDEVAQLGGTINETVAALRTYISEISRLSTAMSEGDFSVSTAAQFRGEFESIGAALNALAESLSETFEHIGTAAQQVNHGAAQISDGAQSLAAGTTEQASAVAQLAATIETLDRHVEANASNAAQASEKASQAGNKITDSNERMKEVIGAMQNIAEKSDEISEIIAAIDEIAFQTNMLALNAAIEAARAGSAGKGFAVVADEVRNLAAKCGEAAQTTSALISQTISAVNEGSELVNETAEALSASVTVTEQAVELINEISAASAQQAAMIRQVNTGVEQISNVVQTNAAAAEQSAAAGEELTGQAGELDRLISGFTTR